MNLLAFGLLFTAAHHGGMFVAVSHRREVNPQLFGNTELLERPSIWSGEGIKVAPVIT